MIRYEYTAEELAEHEIWRQWGRDFISLHRRLAIIGKQPHAVAVYSTEHPQHEGHKLEWRTPWGRPDPYVGIWRKKYLKEFPKAVLYEVFYYSVDCLQEYLKPVNGPCDICGARHTRHNPTTPFAHLMRSCIGASWLMVCSGCWHVLTGQMRKYCILDAHAGEKELFDVVLAVKASELKLALQRGRFARRIAALRNRQRDELRCRKDLERRAEEKREHEELQHSEWRRRYLLDKFARFAFKFYRRDRPIMERMARRKRARTIKKITQVYVMLHERDKKFPPQEMGVKESVAAAQIELSRRPTRREQRLAWHRDNM